ncbi:MAG: Fe-S protein assembly co-chaperone HscB [Rickettsiales bacterium]|jgi:molecular chaperone HscB|nr:Fe-S protein assembly co-chaperone HscB [Rickettsiales bacterium]
MINYFKVLNLPTNFDLNISDIEDSYRKLQQKFHPDSNNQESANDEQSFLVNSALEIISDKFLRACHLLELSGFNINDENFIIKASIGPEPSTIEEIIDLQETILYLDSKENANNLKKECDEKFANLISLAISKYDLNNLQDASKLLIKAKYFRKIIADLKKKIKLLK